ncbi:MAG: hypothetical protein LBM64_00270 [Deltaproteobacteria bacterium]|jgi:hypothetical protein|nr:hypothetical protein [Deltaproteobacteria bacterium]
MHGKTLAFLLGLVALFICCGAAGLNPDGALASSQAKKEDAPPPHDLPAMEDPRRIVDILQQAIDTRDSELADSRIDFNTLGVAFLNNTMPQINERLRSGALTLPQPLPALLGSLNASSVSSRRPAQLFLSGELRTFVLYGVASGYFAGQPRPQNELTGLDGGLFLNLAALKPSRQKFGPAVLAAQDEASALILTSLTDSASGKSYELELMLAREDQSWVVYSIENADELFEQALER